MSVLLTFLYFFPRLSTKRSKKSHSFISLHLCIYPPDSQKRVGSAIHRGLASRNEKVNKTINTLTNARSENALKHQTICFKRDKSCFEKRAIKFIFFCLYTRRKNFSAAKVIRTAVKLSNDSECRYMIKLM